MFTELLADYPEPLRQALMAAKMSDEWIDVGIAERTKLAELATELRAGPNIPDVPLIALTVVGTDPAQQALTSERTLQEMYDGHTRMDAALVSAASDGEQRILSDAVHHRLCFDRPDAVVQAIRDVVDRAGLRADRAPLITLGETWLYEDQVARRYEDPVARPLEETVLTISQLAATAGVTVRTAGVPLARIDALLHAQPAEFAEAISDIDAALQRKIDQLTEYRRRIAELAGGERLVLPPEVVAILDRMRGLGVSERRVRLERDAWILMRALDPHAMPQRIRDKNAGFDDPETTRLYFACDQAVDWDPHDPRLGPLIDDLDAWEIKHERDSGRPGLVKLISSQISEASPAWQRILSALAHRARQRRPTEHDS